MAEEEVLFEVEAVQAVYGNDCYVIHEVPPHLNIHIKPRTADDSSQQFVEAVLGIRASPQYPTEAPRLDIIDSKGLDEKRQAYLVTKVKEKAEELTSCLMLVALCEEAVETLSNMNHPDGDCPLCLYPLVQEEGNGDILPFMKLMSCFHCFHSQCIVRWWKWLHEQNESMSSSSVEGELPTSSDLGPHNTVKKGRGSCPVCRKMFDVKDIEHAIDLLETDSSQLILVDTGINDDEKYFLQSEAENNRRQKFEAMLKLQQENSGLIEPRKHHVLLPAMFLPEPITQPSTSSETTIQQQDEGDTGNPTSETHLSSSSNSHSNKEHKDNTRKKNKGHHPRKQHNARSSRKQWLKKDMGD